MTVASIMLDCLTTLKKEIPELEMAYYKQDNAGCYHSGNSIISAKLAGDAIGVAVVRNDFSDPLGGKGVCDRKAATIKGSYVGRYVNEGTRNHRSESKSCCCQTVKHLSLISNVMA